MEGTATRSKGRRALLLLAPAAVVARLLPAQIPGHDRDDTNLEDSRMPNGKRQQDEIIKANYEKNLKEARELIDIAKSFEEDLEKDDRFVLSIGSLKKLDNMENLIHRIRGRMKKL